MSDTLAVLKAARADTKVALIPLTQGQHAVVDSADYTWLSQYKWFASWSNRSHCFYAKRNIAAGPYKQRTVSMHGEILGLRGRLITADHVVPGNGLDNRRCNLRPATASEQRINQRNRSNNKAGSKGVHLHKPGIWRAIFFRNGKRHDMGSHRSVAEAAAAYSKGVALFDAAIARLEADDDDAR